MTATPDLRTLLRIPEYRTYFSTRYKLPANLLHDGQLPWRLWVKRAGTTPASFRWGKADYPRYVPAYNFLRQILERADVIDAAITCRPAGFQPTIELEYALIREELAGFDLAWCKHCRRPVQFGYFDHHHAYRAMGHAIYDAGESARCPYCATREAAQ